MTFLAQKEKRNLIIGIDPGYKISGWVKWDSEQETLEEFGIDDNDILLERLPYDGTDYIAIEMIQCFGMPVGAEVIETCVWIGKFMDRARLYPVKRIFRKDIKTHFCGSVRANDSNIRQALIDRFGEPGTKKNPGKLYGIKSHIWPALAVAVCCGDRLKMEVIEK